MPGPLPDPNARRRNKPTIPTTTQPASGRTEPAPDVPGWIELLAAGRMFWDWAWQTPQAAAWHESMAPAVARRAQLEDDLAELERVSGLDFTELIDADNQAEIDRAIRRVAALATGKLQITKMALELDNRLGLNPKAMADLRWKIVADGGTEPSTTDPATTGGNVVPIKKRVKAADPDAVAGS